MTDKVQMAASDFNLEKLSTKQLENHIEASIKAQSNIAIFGRRGLGKTQISKQKIKDMGCLEVYMNLSVFERVDLGGYPDMLSPKEKQERFISYLLPKMYEPMIFGDKKVVALLDEVDKADPSLWAPLLEFTNLHSINGRPLPNLQSVIMTGNLISEGGARPSLPLLDRTEKYLVEASAEAFLAWAAATGEIHPSVYQLINDDTTLLQGAVDSPDNYADPSPRGWHLSSKVISHGEEAGWPAELINEKVSGYVGKTAGLAYKMYYTNYKVLIPLVKKIFKGEDFSSEWNKITPTEKLYTTSIVCSRFTGELDKSTPESPPDSINHVGLFMQKAGFENLLIGVRQQILIHRLIKFNLDAHPAWKDTILELKSVANS